MRDLSPRAFILQNHVQYVNRHCLGGTNNHCSTTTHEKKNWPPWLLTVSSPWAHRDQAVTEPWPGPWLSCDLAVTEPWSYRRCRDWAVTSPWLSCDLAVTELWPRRDWGVTSPSRDWAVIIGPGAVTTVVTVSSRWQFFFSWAVYSVFDIM